MSNKSPISVLYGFNGTTYIEGSIYAGLTIPSNQPGILALGSDGTVARYLRTASDGTLRVDPTGTTTQPVSIAGSVAVTGPLTDTQLRATPVPVSGTITANAGTGNFTVVQATAANLNATISIAAAQTLATVTTVSAVTAITNALPTGSNVIGAVTQSGTWTVQPGNTANTTPWLTTINQGGNSATVTAGNALKVDGSAVTQPVSIAGTVAVSGPLTDTQLRATAVPVSGTVTANQGGTWNINNISGTVSLPTGAATETTLSAVSGKLPATLGQKTMANSLAIVIASDQSSVPIKQTSSTAATSSVASSASSVTLLALNTSRLGATIWNDSTKVLYIKLGTTASSTDYTAQLDRDGYYEIPFGYTGRIDGIWASANGNARITEIT